MPTAIINSESSLQTCIGLLREMFRTDHYVKVTAKPGNPRSLSQNDISHAWYEQIASELREDDALGWKCYAKLHHGIPILRAEDADFREAYDQVIKPLPYEKKLIAMRHWPVTSLMNKTQLSKYLEAVQEDFKAKGVRLEFPEEAGK